jgi:hypothetical protein
MNAISRLIWRRRIRFWERKLEYANRMVYLQPWIKDQYENTVRVYKELEIAKENLEITLASRNNTWVRYWQ